MCAAAATTIDCADLKRVVVIVCRFDDDDDDDAL
jgi:hypothetical protein|tara:strand:+ start:178 stop:279 length:102 start_codon:yes stop_codon:yes gene_type:complete